MRAACGKERCAVGCRRCGCLWVSQCGPPSTGQRMTTNRARDTSQASRHLSPSELTDGEASDAQGLRFSVFSSFHM